MADPKPVDYALDQLSSVVHVADALDKAAPAALPLADLVKTYKHSIPADLSRICRHEGVEEDYDAREWLVKRAIEFLGKGVQMVEGQVSFAEGYDFDKLRYLKKKVPRPEVNIHAVLRDPFNTMSGEFSDNIRSELGDVTELRQSMKDWGWIDRPQFRALGDKRTRVILIGHRRIEIAKELGIEWEKHTDYIDIGEGDAADAERFKLAIASNIAGSKMSPKDRKRIAAYLYGEQEWSQERVAAALGVFARTISRDLEEFGIVPNPKRGGRPRKPKKEKAPKEDRRTQLEKYPEMAAFIERGDGEGMSNAEIGKLFGNANERTVRQVKAAVEGRRVGYELAKAGAEIPTTVPPAEPAQTEMNLPDVDLTSFDPPAAETPPETPVERKPVITVGMLKAALATMPDDMVIDDLVAFFQQLKGLATA